MRRILSVTRSGFLNGISSPRMQAAVCGLAAGFVVLAWCFEWTAQFGTSLPAVSALVLAMLLALELGWRPLKSGNASRSLGTALGWQGFLAAWTLAFPWLLDWHSGFLEVFSPTQLAVPGLALAVLFGIALVLVTPPAYALSRMPFCVLAKSAAAEKPSSPGSITALFLGGTAAGGLLSAFVLAPGFGVATAALGGALLGAMFLAAALVWSPSSSETPPADAAEESISTTPPADRSLWDKTGREVWTGLILVCLGGMFAWASRAVDQLMPVSVAIVCSKWAFLVLGWAGGLAWGQRSSAMKTRGRGLAAGLFAGAWLVMLAVSFPWLVNVCLSFTTSVSQVFLLTLCRLAIAGGMLLPFGFAWGLFSALGSQLEVSKRETSAVPLYSAAFLTGWLLSQWVLMTNNSMVAIAVGLSVAVLGLALVRLVWERQWPEGWRTRSLVAGCSLLIVCPLAWSGNYRPETSAKLLFAAPVFDAHRAKLAPELLRVLDEGRLVARAEGPGGTYTLWKYRGVQWQLRQSGLPKGMASGDVRMCPEFSAELLPAAFPLVLHERPATMLILGLGSGVPVTTSLAFPTQEVTCAESDPALIAMVKDHIWTQRPSDPAKDSRLTILPIDPALCLRAERKTFDVIVSLPHQPALAQTAAYFTQSFYHDAAERLSEDGLFCQRLAFIDLGPEALRAAARTMQSAFRDVVFLEMAGGEMLLIGTNSPRGVAREGLIERLQREHVRRQLGHLGWDWSVPLNLAAFDNEALKTFSTKNARWSQTANTVSNGTLAFRLPAEMMRWGPKPFENQEALAPLGERFAQWGGVDPKDPDLLRRLAEVTGQRNLMTSHPDEFWVYRKTVKEQITKNPRSIIVQVKGERPRREIHEEEKRRLAYFRALGDTVKHYPHRPEDIARVESFADPYDPLVTFFLHQEVAELYSRSAVRDCPAELAHRFYSLFYSAPGDRSVRNVTAAIDLLCDHPEAAPDPLDRWDRLNAVLQMMKQRWAVRAGVTPSSTQVAINDVEKSVAAVNRAMQTMDHLREDAGIDAEDWQARRRFLEMTVVNPLRAYRRRLLPILKRQRGHQEQQQSQDPAQVDNGGIAP